MLKKPDDLGIESLCIIPPKKNCISLDPQIQTFFSESECVRAAIAFWSISEYQLQRLTGNRGIQVLKNEDSFLCVDIQNPTNIDHLASLVQKGVKVFLNIRRLPGPLAKYSTSSGLLHTKMLLSNRSNEQADFWIGSHNWTLPALEGPNKEGSMALRLDRDGALYTKVLSFLEDIRTNYYRPFDSGKVDFYKLLQEKMSQRVPGESIDVIKMEGEGVDQLQGEVIGVFGRNAKDYRDIRMVDRQVMLLITDSKSGKEYRYSATIVQSGRLDSSNPTIQGVSFSKRRFAIVDGRLPVLEPEQQPNSMLLSKAKFFATIQIDAPELKDICLLDTSESKVPTWVPEFYDPAIEQMSSEARALYSDLGKSGQTLVLRGFDYKEEGRHDELWQKGEEATDTRQAPVKKEKTYQLIQKKWMVDPDIEN